MNLAWQFPQIWAQYEIVAINPPGGLSMQEKCPPVLSDRTDNI